MKIVSKGAITALLIGAAALFGATNANAQLATGIASAMTGSSSILNQNFNGPSNAGEALGNGRSIVGGTTEVVNVCSKGGGWIINLLGNGGGTHHVGPDMKCVKLQMTNEVATSFMNIVATYAVHGIPDYAGAPRRFFGLAATVIQCDTSIGAYVPEFCDVMKTQLHQLAVYLTSGTYWHHSKSVSSVTIKNNKIAEAASRKLAAMQAAAKTDPPAKPVASADKPILHTAAAAQLPTMLSSAPGWCHKKGLAFETIAACVGPKAATAFNNAHSPGAFPTS